MLLRFLTAPDSERKMQLETSCSIYLNTLNATSHPVLYTEIEPPVPSLYIALSVLRQEHYPQNRCLVHQFRHLIGYQYICGFHVSYGDDGAGNVSDGFKGGAESSRALLPGSLISPSHL